MSNSPRKKRGGGVAALKNLDLQNWCVFSESGDFSPEACLDMLPLNCLWLPLLYNKLF